MEVKGPCRGPRALQDPVAEPKQDVCLQRGLRRAGPAEGAGVGGRPQARDGPLQVRLGDANVVRRRARQGHLSVRLGVAEETVATTVNAETLHKTMHIRPPPSSASSAAALRPTHPSRPLSAAQRLSAPPVDSSASTQAWCPKNQFVHKLSYVMPTWQNPPNAVTCRLYFYFHCSVAFWFLFDHLFRLNKR